MYLRQYILTCYSKRKKKISKNIEIMYEVYKVEGDRVCGWWATGVCILY